MNILLLLISTFICIVSNVIGNHTVVTVEQGRLVGAKLNLSSGNGTYFSYKGIPYAEAPVGPLRFMAPEPPLAWNGTRDATEHGSVCPQLDFYENVLIPGDEDCLFLNVYTSSITSKKLMPVMVFIHGGGYQAGSGNIDLYGPDFIVESGVVLVTINYRLGALGYLSLDTEDVPGNAGMKDQVAALKWVQTNIKKFCGDPDTVTIFGESAGAASVGFHLLSPLSKGLFKRAYLMSGVPYCDFNIHYQPVKRAFKLGELLAIETDSTSDLLQVLQEVNATDLVTNLPYLLAGEDVFNIYLKMFTYAPSVEKVGANKFLSDTAQNIIQSGKVNEADIMFGYNDNELLFAVNDFENFLLRRYIDYGEMLVPTKILFQNTPDVILELSAKIREYYFGYENLDFNSTMKEVIHFVSNATYVYDIQRFFKSYPKSQNKTMFFYKFSAVTKRNVFGSAGAKYGITGAAQRDMLMYLFNPKAYNLTLEQNSEEYRLLKQVTKIVTNFAKYGNPTPDSSLGVTWTKFNSTQMNYLNIGNTLAMSKAPDKDDVSFWKTILEYAKITF